MIQCGDILEILPGYDADTFDLIVADPPYYKVKMGEAWDRQWGSVDAYLAWLDKVLAEFARVLKPNGSLYLFAGPKLAARVEVLVGERLNVLNCIRWVKDAGWHHKTKKNELRTYLAPWEAVLFAEHHNADSTAKGESGYSAKCDELRGFVFEPLRAYLDGERRRAGVSMSVLHDAWCNMQGTKGRMVGHWFTACQWRMVTPYTYDFLQRLFNAACNGSGPQYLRRQYGDLRREYEDLRREYSQLREQFEALRRPFAVTADVAYTDVWDFPTVQSYKGKHPCEKPLALMEHIVRASSREGAKVLDPFCGSGVTGEACRNLGREFVGVDADPHWCEVARERERELPLLAGQ